MYEIFFNLSIKCLLIILLIGLSGPLLSQDLPKIDSLKTLLLTSEGVAKCDNLLELGITYARDNKYHEALPYASEAYTLSWKVGDSARIVKSGRIKGQILNRIDQIKEATAVLTEVLPIAKRNNLRNDYKIILNGLAFDYTIQADYDKALGLNFQTLILREEDGDKSEISVTLSNIGFAYFKLKNYNQAIEYFDRSLLLKEQVKEVYELDRLLINLGLCYNQLKDFKKSQMYFSRAFKVCDTSCDNQINVEGNFGLGVANYGLKDFDRGKYYFYKSYALARRINNNRFQGDNLLYLGHIYVQTGNSDSALYVLTNAEQIAYKEGYNELLIETYKEFSRYFSNAKDFEKASSYQKKYIALKDSIYSEQLIDNIAKVQTDYAERENIATIASKEKMIKQQRDLNFAVAVIAILAGLLILVLQRGNRNIKQVNAKLSEAKETIQEQNRLLEGKNKDLDRQVAEKTADLEKVNSSLKQVNDELDNFIYKTSHDIRGPLASLKGMCNVALLDVKDPIALDYLRKLDTTAERLNTILTRLLIINQINNSKLSVSPIDFEGVVNDVLMLERKKGLPQNLRISKQIDVDAVIHSDKELVRIVLENLVDNSIKFYNDSERVDSFVEVRIATGNGGTVKVSVIDNGIGISESDPGKLFQMFFRASERSEIGGIGLYIVKTATSKLGGRVGLQTTEEGYTEFYVTFPQYPSQADEIPEKGHFF